MAQSFYDYGYFRDEGTFIVSTMTPKMLKLEVDMDIIRGQGEIWQQKHTEFAQEIKDMEWECLSNCMFFVWCKNHQYTGWMREIKVSKPLRHQRWLSLASTSFYLFFS